MNDDYLWDGSGEADEETRRLEALLGSYRSTRPAPNFAAVMATQRRVKSVWLLLPIAALIVIGIALPQIIALRTSGWRQGMRVLKAGDVVRTGATSRARLESRSIGVVDVGADTTLRIVETRKGRHRLALEAGTIHARTTSPPGVFVVETPRANAIDLGCEYFLTVAKDGSGSLRVTAGWVELQRGFTQSLVPAGASATFDAEGTLAPPVFDDAPPELKAALRRHDIAHVVALARRRDALTLLNLFSRVSPEERLLVYDRLSQLVPPPPSIPRSALEQWSPGVTDAWWPAVRKASGVGAIKKPRR